MSQTVEELRYQLEDWLAQGFTSLEDRANYQALKKQYEDETLDYSFSKREIIGQLDIIITTRENDFPDLDEVTKEDYLDRKSTRLNSSHANISYAVFCLKKKIQ